MADETLTLQRDILLEAIGSLRKGVKSISIGGRTVVYEDLAKLIRELRDVNAQLSSEIYGPIGNVVVYPERS